MSLLSSWVPDWVKAIWAVISRIGYFFWWILSSLWHLIVVGVTVLITFFAEVIAALGWVADKLVLLWDLITDSGNTYRTLVSSGWPSSLAAPVHWANQHFPVAELIAAFVLLALAYVVATTIRIIKSCIPTVAS